MIATALASLGLAIWAYLALGRGAFWRAQENDGAPCDALARREPAAWPSVVVVIPARDEASLVGTTVASLLGQRYDGDLSIVLVDDHSVDGTAAVAVAAATLAGSADRLTVIAAPALPAGWTGKVWAMAQGVAHVEASPDGPRYLLLTDADIRYGPDTVAALVSSMVDNRLVLSSLMVRLRCESFAERMLIPAFVFFFQMLYPFAWTNRPGHRTAAAAGGCMLVDRQVLRAAGGIASIHGELIDDCALARRLKPHGPIRLALGDRVASVRPYPAIGDIRRMVVRSAYAQLRFSPGRLALVAVAMTLVFIAPPVLAIGGHGLASLLGALAWASMALLFGPMARWYRVSTWWGVALPVIAAIYLAFTVESAVQHRRGRGGLWKGRVNGPGVETQ